MSKIYKINNHLMEYNDKCMDAQGSTPSQTGIKIGDYTWTTTNLEYDDGEEGITIIDNVTANGVNMGTQYYYTWEAAVRVASKIPGWHLPTYAEGFDLYSYRGSRSEACLKSTTGWNSYNSTKPNGFNAYPVGCCYTTTTNPYEVGGRAIFWINELLDNKKPYSLWIDTREVYVGYRDWDTLSYGSRYSIRLVKD